MKSSVPIPHFPVGSRLRVSRATVGRAERRGWRIIKLGQDSYAIESFDGEVWSQGARVFRSRQHARETAIHLFGTE